MLKTKITIKMNHKIPTSRPTDVGLRELSFTYLVRIGRKQDIEILCCHRYRLNELNQKCPQNTPLFCRLRLLFLHLLPPHSKPLTQDTKGSVCSESTLWNEPKRSSWLSQDEPKTHFTMAKLKLARRGRGGDTKRGGDGGGGWPLGGGV